MCGRTEDQARDLLKSSWAAHPNDLAGPVSSTGQDQISDRVKIQLIKTHILHFKRFKVFKYRDFTGETNMVFTKVH